jgi:hypothetical protein
MLLRTYEASAEAAYLQCEVAVGGTEVKWVPWRRIGAVNAPLLHRRTSPFNPRAVMSNQPDQSSDTDQSTSCNQPPNQPDDPMQSSDPLERFNAVARTSKVTTRLPDGRRRVEVKDHDTGEVTVRMLPPDKKFEAYL